MLKKMNNLFNTYEGRVLFSGILMFVSLLAFIGYFGVTDLQKSKTLILAFFAHAFGGRAAGVGLCIIGGLNMTWSILYNFFLEILIVCFTYALFVYSIKNYIKIPWLMTFMNNLIRKANKNKEKVQKYGWLGLFLFVMIPLPVTGPVIGSIIGYLLRIKLWQNFSAVFLGTLAAIVLWVLCFDFLEEHLHIIQYVLIGIISIVLLSHLKSIKELIRK